MNKKLFNNITVIIFSIICCSGFSFLMKYRIYLIFIFFFIQLFKILKDKKIKYVKNNGLFFLILFTLIIAIGMIGSLDRFETFKYLIIYSTIILMIINSYENEYNVKCLDLMIFICKIVAISILLNSFIPTLFRDYLPFLIRSAPNTYSRLTNEINHHIYSGIVGEKGEAAYLMVLFLTLLLGQGIKKNKLDKCDFVWLVIGVLALIIPAKRTLFVVGVFIILCYYLFFTRGKNRIKNTLIIMALVMLFGLVAFQIPQFNTLTTRFIEKSNDTTGNGRVYLWNIANEMFENRKILGYGYGSFNTYATNVGVIISRDRTWSAHAHNIYYQLLAETGVCGFAVFILMVLKTLITNIKLYFRNSKLNNEDRMLLFISFSVILTNILYGLTGNPIYYTNQVMIFFWGIGLSYYLKGKYFGKENIK